jgi:hypothetical protein
MPGRSSTVRTTRKDRPGGEIAARANVLQSEMAAGRMLIKKKKI